MPYVVLGMKPRASRVEAKHVTSRVTSLDLGLFVGFEAEFHVAQATLKLVTYLRVSLNS